MGPGVYTSRSATTTTRTQPLPALRIPSSSLTSLTTLIVSAATLRVLRHTTHTHPCPHTLSDSLHNQDVD